jgi:imidazolonepropionase-like amidohydrolase
MLLAHVMFAALAAAPSVVHPPGSAASERDLALIGVHVVDVAKGLSRPNRTVIVRGGVVVEEGDRRTTRVPRHARRVAGHGGFLIPGLWDMHAHFVHDTTTFALYLAAGVTGVRDMGGSIDTTLALREAVVAGRIAGPRIVSAGLLIDGPKPDLPWRIEVTDSAGACRAVDSLARRGVDFIKVHNGLSRGAYFAVARQARARQLPFAGHIPFGVTPGEAIDAGQASLEHTTALLEAGLPREAARSIQGFETALAAFRRDVAPALYATMVERQVYFTPTLVAARGAWRRFEPDTTIRNRPSVPASIRNWWDAAYPVPREVPKALVDGRRLAFERSIELVRDMHAAGVPLLAGTDVGTFGVLPGASLHEELELLVAAGLTPAEALVSATVAPARFLGLERELGAIEVGRRADFVLLRGNPLEDIRQVRGVVGVVAGGKWYPIGAERRDQEPR